MRRRMGKLLLCGAAALAASLTAATQRPTLRTATEPRIVAPLADPALAPGVARCTSDRVCIVTDDGGTRAGTPLTFSRSR
jgi:hypothetical protein